MCSFKYSFNIAQTDKPSTEHKPNNESHMLRDITNYKFHPVAPYRNRYYTPELSQFWNKLRAEYWSAKRISNLSWVRITCTGSVAELKEWLPEVVISRIYKNIPTHRHKETQAHKVWVYGRTVSVACYRHDSSRYSDWQWRCWWTALCWRDCHFPGLKLGSSSKRS